MIFQRQRHTNNCGQTVLGMLLGWDQDAVAKYIEKSGKTTWRDLDYGLQACSQVQHLIHRPLRVTRRYGLHLGEMMICRVRNRSEKNWSHWIIINEDAQVFDPEMTSWHSLECWQLIMSIAGNYISTFNCVWTLKKQRSKRRTHKC